MWKAPEGSRRYVDNDIETVASEIITVKTAFMFASIDLRRRWCDTGGCLLINVCLKFSAYFLNALSGTDQP